MKKLLFLFSIALFFGCHTSKKVSIQNEKEAPEPEPKIGGFVTWDKKLIDIGTVKKGEKRELAFAFTNTSGIPIQIDIVDACHCTTVDFPRGIIQPGGRANFPVVFDSAEKDADEVIGIYVYFKQTDAAGNPRIERVEYSFKLEK